MYERSGQLTNPSSITSEYPESFRFTEPDASVTGKVTGYSEGPGKFGPVPIVQLIDSDGKAWSVWLFSSILREKVGKAKPLPDEVVRITYLGERTSNASGNTYKAWAVAMPERSEESVPDFASWAGDSTNPDWGDQPGDEPPPWG